MEDCFFAPSTATKKKPVLGKIPPRPVSVNALWESEFGGILARAWPKELEMSQSTIGDQKYFERLPWTECIQKKTSRRWQESEDVGSSLG